MLLTVFRQRQAGGIAILRVKKLDPARLGDSGAAGGPADIRLDDEMPAAASVPFHFQVAKADKADAAKQAQRFSENRIVSALLAQAALADRRRPLAQLAGDEGRQRLTCDRNNSCRSKGCRPCPRSTPARSAGPPTVDTSHRAAAARRGSLP